MLQKTDQFLTKSTPLQIEQTLATFTFDSMVFFKDDHEISQYLFFGKVAPNKATLFPVPKTLWIRGIRGAVWVSWKETQKGTTVKIIYPYWNKYSLPLIVLAALFAPAFFALNDHSFLFLSGFLVFAAVCLTALSAFGQFITYERSKSRMKSVLRGLPQ